MAIGEEFLMKKKDMEKIELTPEQISELDIDLSCSLFHVMSDDTCSETGAKLEEVLLV